MRTREEIEKRLEELEEEKEELMIEKDIYASYDIVEEIAKDVIAEINKPLALTGIKLNLWRIEDQNAKDDDWSLTANYFNDENKNEIFDIEVECKDLYGKLLEDYSIDDLLNIKTYPYGVHDLRWSIAKIAKDLINILMEELVRKGYKD